MLQHIVKKLASSCAFLKKEHPIRFSNRSFGEGIGLQGAVALRFFAAGARGEPGEAGEERRGVDRTRENACSEA